MKKQQFLLVGAGIILFIGIYFFGNTIPPKKNIPAAVAPMSDHHDKALTTEDVLAKAKQPLNTSDAQRITQLENSVVRGDVKNQTEQVYSQLAKFWNITAKRPEIGAYYTGKEGDLEKSEKKLTFAAHLLLNNAMLSDNNPAMQTWMATNAKTFFDKALELNPNNDSTKIGIGACYMFGNISDNPMQGILPVRAIAEKNPDNLYAQMILGLGGIKSGQYDNAIKRFSIVLAKMPDNLEAALNLAEVYDRKGDKANAIKAYNEVLNKITLPEAQKEIKERIKILQQ